MEWGIGGFEEDWRIDGLESKQPRNYVMSQNVGYGGGWPIIDSSDDPSLYHPSLISLMRYVIKIKFPKGVFRLPSNSFFEIPLKEG